MKFVSPKIAQTIPELLLLLTELTTQAFQIQQGIKTYRENDISRLVNVRELQKTSFKSISKSVDRLAKRINRSANR